MNRRPVESSTIESIGYDFPSKTLELRFKNGSTYQYFDVPEPIWQSLLAAPSIGAYFSSAIRGVFRYARV